MPNFAKIIDQNVTKAFDKQLKPGGLTEDVTFKFFVSAGVYDAESDTTVAEYTDVPDVTCVVAKPSFDDVKDSNVVRSDVKLIIPGSKLPADPETDTDKVVRANGELWDVRKTVGVPGRGIFIVYIYRT